MNVVIYARYSSEKQQEMSIEGQLRVCQDYCKRNGWSVLREYADRALSASSHTERRDSFLRMMRDSKQRKFDLVVVYKLSRFARSRYDSAVYKRALRENGVRVVSATEAIGDDPSGALLEGVMEAVDEFYSRSMAQDIKRAMHDNATKALSTGGTIPLGYKSVNKQLTIDELSAPIVREIFSRYATGESYLGLAGSLNARGYRTSVGKPFSKNSFGAILRNRKYIGEYNYNKGEVSLQDAIPALIERSVFETVQKRLEQQRRAPARNKAIVPYLLTGKVFCGECGAFLAGESGVNHDGVRYHYYACGHRKRGKKCDLQYIRKDVLEQFVLSKAADILTPENIHAIAEQAIAVFERDNQLEQRAPALQQAIAEVDEQTRNILRAIERGAQSQALIDRLNTLEQRKTDLSTEVTMLEVNTPKLDVLMIEHWLSAFAQQQDDPHYAENLIDILVNSVFVSNESTCHRVRVVFNLTDSGGRPLSCSDLTEMVHH